VVLTASGEVSLSRRYFWRKGGGGMYPVDESLGLAESRVSPGAREMLCRLGIVEDFAGAAEDAKRIANVPVCKERLRQIVEAEGARVTQVRQEGELKAAWTQADAVVEGTDKTRVYAGIDGVMAPMVTQAEKDKRRKDQVVRRQKRVKQGLKNTRELPAAQKGHDEKYREMKIGVFYDQDKKHRHCFATAKRWEGFANLLKIYAGQVDFAKAIEALTLGSAGAGDSPGKASLPCRPKLTTK
jgi:ribosome-associated translation inhibitor RaiA